SNSATQLNLAGAWSNAPDTTSVYEIGASVIVGMTHGVGDFAFLGDEPGNISGIDQGNIWKVNLNTGVQTLVSSNESASGSQFNHPVDIALDASGNNLI